METMEKETAETQETATWKGPQVSLDNIESLVGQVVDEVGDVPSAQARLTEIAVETERLKAWVMGVYTSGNLNSRRIF